VPAQGVALGVLEFDPIGEEVADIVRLGADRGPRMIRRDRVLTQGNLDHRRPWTLAGGLLDPDDPRTQAECLAGGADHWYDQGVGPPRGDDNGQYTAEFQGRPDRQVGKAQRYVPVQNGDPPRDQPGIPAALMMFAGSGRLRRDRPASLIDSLQAGQAIGIEEPARLDERLDLDGHRGAPLLHIAGGTVGLEIHVAVPVRGEEMDAKGPGMMTVRGKRDRSDIGGERM
jgi:hypothetical protein